MGDGGWIGWMGGYQTNKLREEAVGTKKKKGFLYLIIIYFFYWWGLTFVYEEEGCSNIYNMGKGCKPLSFLLPRTREEGGGERRKGEGRAKRKKEKINK